MANCQWKGKKQNKESHKPSYRSACSASLATYTKFSRSLEEAIADLVDVRFLLVWILELRLYQPLHFSGFLLETKSVNVGAKGLG